MGGMWQPPAIRSPSRRNPDAQSHSVLCRTPPRSECLAANETLPALGGIDGGRLPYRDPAVRGRMSLAIRHHRETRPALAAWNGPYQRATCGAVGRADGICGGLPRVLFRPDL